ncbi:MAG: HAMP domain-containing sensor histidine kinase [Myxococcales bacterium]
MSISRRIRHRLVTVILLGVITSALSLVAMVRVISLTVGSRVERGRVGVNGELTRLIEAGPGALKSPSRSGLIGVRGGFVPERQAPAVVSGTLMAPPDGLPAAWRSAVERTIAAAAAGTPGTLGTLGLSAAPVPVTTETDVDGGVLLVSAQHLPGVSSVGNVAWTAYLVPPPQWLRTWQIIVVALALATGLLATAAINAVFTVKRGAAALTGALDGLASDLNTPVPRPRLRELSDVADGIARLGQRLAQAREVHEGMARELAMKDRLAALGRVVAGVAHEVRNPLASIKLRLDLAAGAGSPLPPAAEEAIAHASGEITRLDRMVADLLVVASPGLGPRQSVALGALVRARVESLAPWSDLRGVDIRVEGDAAAPIDVDAVARAVDNLVRNAVEASPSGGHVEVSVRESELLAVIAVADHGPGVPAERTQELFEPFFTTKPDGTGLGLAICRSIARAHGGEVTFSRRGDATCVELTVARGAPARGEAAVMTGAGASGASGCSARPGVGAVPS